MTKAASCSRPVPALVIVGAGGHAKVVADAAQTAGYTLAGFVDDLAETAPLPGYRVLGRTGDLAAILQELPTARVVLAIGDNAVRRRLSALTVEGRLATVVHPAAVISQYTRLGPGTVCLPGTVVNAGAAVGRHVILNTACSVDHDCRLEDFVHVSPGAHLAGGVVIRTGAWVGTGAAIIPGKTIGEWAVVGAGAVVIEDVPAGAVVAGVPARVIGRNQTPG